MLEDTAWIDVTVGGIPEEDRELLVLPPGGFLVDVSFPAPSSQQGEPSSQQREPSSQRGEPSSQRGQPDTVAASLRPWGEGEERDLGLPVTRRPDGASFRVPRAPALDPGSYTIWATVDWADGVSESVSLAVAVRESSSPPPLHGGQWVQLDFEADRDGDGATDFPIDLASFGLGGGGSSAVDMRVESWVIDEIVRRTGAFYDSNPSMLPEGDPMPVVFSADAPATGPYTRICIGGAAPGENAIIGNVLLDPGNEDRSDEACDDYLPSGVFPREIHYYEDAPGFQEAFAALQAEPAGAHPRDAVLLSHGYAPVDALERGRFDVIRRGVLAFAQVVASVTAHEAAHAMGLVPPGAPGEGLFGGRDGADFTHNLTRRGAVPDELYLMNPGPSLSFDDLVGANGPLRLRALNFAYLQGRLLLDPRVDGIHPPPRLLSLSPAHIWTDSSLLALLEIEGRGLQGSPTVILRGHADFLVAHTATVTGRDGENDKVIANVLAPTLEPGTYDLELTNPDGQRATLTRALQVR